MIRVLNLTKKFNGFLAVDNISFKIRKREIFAFLGPNGAGKTTTIKMLTTLLSPTSGGIFLDGINAIENPEEARKKFGIVFQDPSLDEELTARENMEFHAILYKLPSNIRKQRVEELLKFVELWDRRSSIVKTFSGGMKRRLEIARGLLHHPQIIFLDEPTLGLDPQTRSHIWSYIQALSEREGITIFFTTHYMEEAQKVAKKVAIIDKGKIATSGTPQKLMEKTKSTSLEEAFLKLTGQEIREEESGALEQRRLDRRIWGGKR